jgi:hypothetical protein
LPPQQGLSVVKPLSAETKNGTLRNKVEAQERRRRAENANANTLITHTDKKGTIIKGYAESNKFAGGRIILKIKGQTSLIYLNVDDLKVPRQ